MTASVAFDSHDPERVRRVKMLRFRQREHECRAEEALDGGDLPTFQDQRHTSRLERDVADEAERSGDRGH